MTVIVMECAPESVRGELTRWFLELKPGVFVGNVNVRIRELLWKRVCRPMPLQVLSWFFLLRMSRASK